MDFLDEKDFAQIAGQLMKTDSNGTRKGHWKNYEQRWRYHSRAIDLIKKSGVSDPKCVLEMGTMGASLVRGSDTIDYSLNWNFNGFRPTYEHDARIFPWPIETKKYDWFVALRVYHHLYPVQRLAFEEAKRVARNVLIVVPNDVGQNKKEKGLLRTDAGISAAQFTDWNGGIPPTVIESVEPYGYLYWWDEAATRLYKTTSHAGLFNYEILKARFTIFLQNANLASRRIAKRAKKLRRISRVT